MDGAALMSSITALDQSAIGTERALLTDLLKTVSRSFYLTLRVLPGSVRAQIGLAYLLARTTDTIADTELVPVTNRLAALEALRRRIEGDGAGEVRDVFRELAAAQPDLVGGGTSAERVLLERVEDALALLASFSVEDKKLIRDVLATITSGQVLDLQRFGDCNAEKIGALQSETELDDYTFRVAGCVGEFWTKICRAHVYPEANLDDDSLLRDGVRFGKGLQLVNILRDLPRDLRQGRCYLARERLARAGLQPADLLRAESIGKLRPAYDELLNVADAHLAAGWRYTNTLPRSAIRIRLACAWPVLIGAKTLARLRTANPLDASQRVKISRAELKRIIGATVVRYPLSRAWHELFERSHARVHRAGR
jgi:farnesyl-diphosphate farnesyltransferase